MTEIEIRPGGELLFHDEVVGRITWERHRRGIESELAGIYGNYWDADEFGKYYPCNSCGDKDEEIEELEVGLHKAQTRVAQLEAKLAAQESDR